MFPELLREKLAGIATLTLGQIQLLHNHYRMLDRWNRKLNLTAIDSLEEAVERHYCESIFLATHLPPSPLRIADVGSGGGFPGVPVAVIRTDCSVALIESHQRKAVFLKEATRRMRHVHVVARRAEDLWQDPDFQRFDCVISRAVSYDDLVPVLNRLANTAQLLTGAEPPPKGLCFTWKNPIPLPWGKQRFLRAGRLTSDLGTLS